MIAWSDVGKIGVAAIFKRSIDIKQCPVIYYEFNRQMARCLCLIHGWCSYEHGVFVETV